MKNMDMKEIRKLILDYALIILGNLAYAIAVVEFIRPVDVIVGGVGGIAQMLNYLFNLPMGTMIIVMNIPLFVLSFKVMGRRFIIRTVVATVASSLMIDLLSPFIANIRLTEDTLLSVLYGGVLMGAGLGLVFSRGATTGGSDILSKLVIKKFSHLSIGRINLCINAVVIVAAAFVYRSPEAALYAIVVQYISGSVIDMLLSGMDHATAALIVTRRGQEISDAVFNEMRRGCTGLGSQGMYTHREHMTLVVAARSHEMGQLKSIVHKIDPESFVVLLNAREVLGLGFKSYNQ